MALFVDSRLAEDSRLETILTRVALVAGFLLALSRPGYADQQQDFQVHYEAAQRDYHAGMWQQAIREFQLAYEIKARPRLLHDMAQAYRNLGRPREATDLFQRY